MDEYLIFKWLQDLDHWGGTQQGIYRLAFSDEEKQARNYIVKLMKKYGMDVHVDNAANIIGRYVGTEPELPAVAIGSHLDSVPNGGRYDGVLGVLSGLEIVRYLSENNIRGRHSLELIIFSNEEGCRYPCTLFGSSVMMGEFTSSLEELKEMKDEKGISLFEAIGNLGGDPENLGQAVREPQEFKAFLELHIEQGLVLENKGVAIGIVEGIAAPVRYILELYGKANHAGTTPMDLRNDPLLGASEIMLGLEKIVTETSLTGVATVGQINIKPGAVNIIPGQATLAFDIRDYNLVTRNKIIAKFQELIKEISIKRKIKYELNETFSIEPIALDKDLSCLTEKACQAENIIAQRMISGAGHDAMMLAKYVPTGMIFIPSVNGVSHSPEEFTRETDIIAGIKVLRRVCTELIK